MRSGKSESNKGKNLYGLKSFKSWGFSWRHTQFKKKKKEN